jgi:hypothetical protein
VFYRQNGSVTDLVGFVSTQYVQGLEVRSLMLVDVIPYMKLLAQVGEAYALPTTRAVEHEEPT